MSAGGKWEKVAYVGTYHVFTAVDGDADYGTDELLSIQASDITIADITLKLDGHQPDHWDIVLNQLSVDLGMDL